MPILLYTWELYICVGGICVGWICVGWICVRFICVCDEGVTLNSLNSLVLVKLLSQIFHCLVFNESKSSSHSCFLKSYITPVILVSNDMFWRQIFVAVLIFKEIFYENIIFFVFIHWITQYYESFSQNLIWNLILKII